VDPKGKRMRDVMTVKGPRLKNSKDPIAEQEQLQPRATEESTRSGYWLTRGRHRALKYRRPQQSVWLELGKAVRWTDPLLAT
jgi:hypothetical protein